MAPVGPRTILAPTAISPLALRRLTRVNTRSVEQPVNLDDGDDVFNWPWLNAGEMGDWKLTDRQAKALREYLLRGGFLMLDDFWGTEEMGRFEESMSSFFRTVPSSRWTTPIPFFTPFTISTTVIRSPDNGLSVRGTTYRADGQVAHWLGIYDDRQRVMVAMSFNSDIGDSWEWADDPQYPEKYSALGIRIGVNYVVYAMTH